MSTSNTQVVVNTTRPADTVAYSVNDAIGDTAGSAIFSGYVAEGPAGVFLTDVNVYINQSGLSGLGTLQLHLFSAAPTAIADNAAFSLSSADGMSSYLQSITLAQPTVLGGIAKSINPMQNTKFHLPSANVWFIITTDAAFTPVSAMVTKIVLQFTPA